jgi:signal transduction histidine kinase
MEVRARVRRALPRPSPRVRLAWFLAGAAIAVAVAGTAAASPILLGGAIPLGGASALAVTTRIVRTRERREVVAVLSAAERARLLREFIAARERERRALWERLHDDVLQTTAGNLLRLDAARMLLEEGRAEEAIRLLTESSRTERRVFDDLRRLMAAMNVEPSRTPSEDPLQVLVAIPEPQAAPPVR